MWWVNCWETLIEHQDVCWNIQNVSASHDRILAMHNRDWFSSLYFSFVFPMKKKIHPSTKKKFLLVHLRISTRYTFRRCLHWIKCRTEGNNYRFFLTIFCCITEMRMEILDNSLSRCSQNWNLTVIRKLFHWSTQVFNILSHRISNLYFKLLSLLDSRSNRINEENF